MKVNQKQVVSAFILFVLIFSQFAYPQSVHAASTLHVVPGGPASGTCSAIDWSDACDLQYALSIASSGDEIWVRQGTYKPTTGTDRAVSFNLVNGVAIYGGFLAETALISNPNPALTILSGEIGGAGVGDNSYHVVQASSVVDGVLDGFTVKDGNANVGGNDYGGGFHLANSKVVLRNLIISNNLANAAGGGMYISSSLPNNSPQISSTKFQNNSASRGGGLYSQDADPELNDVRFESNSATGGAGGGAHFVGNPTVTPTLMDVTFIGNTANGGAGMFLGYGPGSLTNVTFRSNTANRRGGGLLLELSSAVLTNVTFYANISLNTLADPRGGGGLMNLASNPTLNNVTFSGNTSTANGVDGSAIRIVKDPAGSTTSAPIIHNSIFWGDTTTEITSDGTGSITVINSIVQGGCPAGGTCTNVIGNDPLLSTPALNGGLTENMALGVLSPAINTGNNATCATTDQRGVARPQDSICDMGAYEYDFAPTITDRSPVIGATGIFEDTNITVTFSERMNAATITDTSFTLRADGAGSDVPASVSYADRVATLNPTADLASGTLYHVTVAGSVADLKGNILGSNVTWSFTTGGGTPINASDTTVADFNGGTVGNCVVDNTVGDGALRLNIPSSSSCIFTSRIFDADESVDWNELIFSGTIPAGTSVSFETRTGKRFVQDDTWSAWQAVNSLIASPDGQYLQYRVTLTTTVVNQTPTVAQVILTYNTKAPAVLGTPNTVMTSWSNSFNWTGIASATYYLLEIYTTTDAPVLRKWYTSAATSCDTDLTCTLSPAELNVLANGSYKWRIEDLGTYGHGLKTAYTNFTLSAPMVTLNTPNSTVTSWNNTFSWNGVSGPTLYLLEVYTDTNTQVHRKWYSTAAAGCDTDTSCVISPVELASLANGNYKWRIRDYGAYGYGFFTAYTNFVLNVPPPPTVSLIAPTGGPLTSWNNTFSWTGFSGPTLYLLEVYTDTNTQVHRKWYSTAAAGCDADTSCAITPAELASLANGGYKWRIRDYGAYGYGLYTAYTNFSLNVPPPPVVTLGTPNTTMTSWDNTFSWTGFSGPTLYLLEVYTDGGTQVHRKWYSTIAAGCDTDTSCAISPVELASLANGSYKWRIRDYGGYGYGSYTAYTNFALNP